MMPQPAGYLASGAMAARLKTILSHSEPLENAKQKAPIESFRDIVCPPEMQPLPQLRVAARVQLISG